MIDLGRRVHEQTSRKDFMSYLLQDQAVKQLSIVQLAAHGSDFVYGHALEPYVTS